VGEGLAVLAAGQFSRLELVAAEVTEASITRGIDGMMIVGPVSLDHPSSTRLCQDY